jgi:hypothetical protein
VTAFFERARAYGAPPVPVYAPVTQRLHVDGRIFRTDDGRAFRVKFETQFVAPRLFDQGAFDQLEALVAQSHADRYNGWVCFFRHVFVDWNTQIAPPIKANPYVFPMTKRRPFVDWLAARGLYVQAVILTDCQAFGTDDDGTPLPAFDLAHADQVQDVRETIAALASAPNVLGRIANEPSENGVDVVRLSEDLGLFDRANRPFLMELGSYPITGHEPNFRVLDFIGDHPERKPSWTSETGKTGEYVYRQTGVPWLFMEGPKFSREDNPDGESTECDPVTSPLRAAEGFAGVALSGAGGTWHGWSGIHAQIRSALESQCARLASEAMDAFPADAPNGAYVHDNDGAWLVPVNDETIVGEVAGRMCGTRQYLAASMITPRWQPQPIGAQMTRSGAQGERITLTR